MGLRFSSAMEFPRASIEVEHGGVMANYHILVVTGASGAGKTTAVEALNARHVPGTRCFFFDSIGIPSIEVMERDFGGGEQWQAFATAEWLSRLSALPEDVRVAVLDGQTRPSFVFDAAASAPRRSVHVVLLDCSPDVRTMRLTGARRQPELASERMNNWAAYLRGQADALHLDVIDTTSLTVTEVAARLETLVRRLIA
jgi:RNase adaptor protein for sRNA GlmZ degradation